MSEYISPAWDIEIGPYTVQKMTRFDVVSSRQAPIDLAEVELPNAGLPADIAAGDRVRISQGYREKGLWLIFDGEIARLEPRSTTTMIFAQDQGVKLKRTEFSQTFIQVQPRAIIQQGLQKAGVTAYRLSSKALPPRPSFVASGNCLEVFKRVNMTWGLDWAYYFEPEGEFYWGPWEESPRYEQTELTRLEYGVNILEPTRVENGGERGLITTFAMPWIRHSHRVIIVDPRHFAEPVEARVERCHYHHDAQKARLTLEWSRGKK